MRQATPALIDLLKSQTFLTCHLYAVTLISGIQYFWTDADIDIVADGQVFKADGPSISGAKYHLVRGMQISDLQLTVLVKPDDLIAGVPWFLATRSGALKNAQVRIFKAFLSSWSQPAESLLIFDGEVSESYDTDQQVVLTVQSLSKRLDAKIPRQLFTPGCLRTLYDAGCGVSKSTYSFNGAVQTVVARHTFGVSLGKPDNFFSYGEIIFQSGNNAGVRRSVKLYANEMITLSYPLVFDLDVGDAFLIRAGCDRTRGAGGCAKFANDSNFRGMPFIPTPESAI